MSSTPVFDSLTHPMPNGNWLTPRHDGLNTVQRLLEEMEKNNVLWALAVGMGPDIGGYKEDTYAKFIKSHSDNLFPVAYLDLTKGLTATTIIEHLQHLKELGYVGIKIHPRLTGIDFSHPLLVEVIRSANRIDLSVLICTYFWGRNERLCLIGPEQLHALLCKVPEEKIILMHGGGVRLLEVAEMARQFQNVLLDLSFTLCKYEGSSIDLDIRFLFERFDRRICIGSDNPEIGLFNLRRRFDALSHGLDNAQKSNIGHRNLQSHLGIGI